MLRAGENGSVSLVDAGGPRPSSKRNQSLFDWRISGPTNRFTPANKLAIPLIRLHIAVADQSYRRMSWKAESLVWRVETMAPASCQYIVLGFVYHRFQKKGAEG